MDNAERKGIQPKTVRESEKDEMVSFKKFTEDEGFQTNFEADVPDTDKIVKKSPMLGKKEYFRSKAEKLKEYIDTKAKGTYQYKIRQLIEDAKKQRENGRVTIKKTLSPENRLPSDISNKNIYISQRALKFK